MAPVVLFVVALAAERRALQGLLQARRSERLGERRAVRGRLADRDVLLVQAGIGRDRARQVVAAVSREFELQAAWSLGFAGGLSERVHPGDLVYPTAILDMADPTAPPLTADATHPIVHTALRKAGLPVEAGPLMTVEAVLRTPDAKWVAGRRSGAVAVEMEAAGVARAARDLGIPWAALKAVVDGVGDPLPQFLEGCTTPGGDLRWRGLWTGALEHRPFWRALYQVGRASRRASRSLCQGLEVAFGAWAALTP